MTSGGASTSGGEPGGGGDHRALSTPGPSGTVRRVLIAVCWLWITGTALVEPRRLLLPWWVTALAFLVIGLGCAAELGTAFACKEQRSHTRLRIQVLRVALVLLAGCSIAGALTSTAPSMAFRSDSGDVLFEYGLSGVVAPTLWAGILVTSISAIMAPSPRRSPRPLALGSRGGRCSS